MASRQHDGDLFGGIIAIEAAGGMDGFVREVVAETKTTAIARLNRNTVEAELPTLVKDVLTQIVQRRLRADLAVIVARAMTQPGDGEQACAEAVDRVGRIAAEIAKRVNYG